MEHGLPFLLAHRYYHLGLVTLVEVLEKATALEFIIRGLELVLVLLSTQVQI